MTALADLTLAEGFVFHEKTKLSLADLNQMLTYPVLRACRDAIRVMPTDDIGEAIRTGVETDQPETKGVAKQVHDILLIAASRIGKTDNPLEDWNKVRAKAVSILETEQMLWDWEDFIRAIACVVWLYQHRSNPLFEFEHYLDATTMDECITQFYQLTTPEESPSEDEFKGDSSGPLDS